MIGGVLFVAVFILAVIAMAMLTAPTPQTEPESTTDGRVKRLAEAIARAEGFYVAGSRPARNNNPGNLTVDIAGGGTAAGRDGAFVTYATADAGWADLYAQVQLMLSGGSRYYSPQMTIEEMAMVYTTTQQAAWAQNVSNALRVPVTTKISEV